MPPPEGEGVTSEGEEGLKGNGVGKPVRRFTSEQLRKLNKPENAHVAVRGKVSLSL